MGANLKHFEKYKEKLLLYAKAVGLKIKYVSSADDGVYIPLRRVIEIDKDLPESTEVAALLHELGHSFDDSFQAAVVGPKAFKLINKAYTKVYSKHPSRKERALVLKCERRAWLYGAAIAKRLQIRLGAWYYSYMRECLKGYKE